MEDKNRGGKKRRKGGLSGGRGADWRGFSGERNLRGMDTIIFFGLHAFFLLLFLAPLHCLDMDIIGYVFIWFVPLRFPWPHLGYSGCSFCGFGLHLFISSLVFIMIWALVYVTRYVVFHVVFYF